MKAMTTQMTSIYSKDPVGYDTAFNILCALTGT